MPKLTQYLLLVLLLHAPLTLATDAVPPLINYQGTLTDENGAPINGTRRLEFSIYDAPIGGNRVWGPQVFDAVPVIGGRFNVILGTTDVDGHLISDAFQEEGRYLAFSVNGAPEFSVRQQAVSAPYALYSGHSAFSAKAGTIETQNLFIEPTSGNVGVGVTQPVKKLHVVGDSFVDGALSISNGIQSDYDSGWFPVQSTTANIIELTHDLGSIPSRYSLHFSTDNPPSDGIYDLTGQGWYANNHPCNSAIHAGSIKMTTDHVEIPIWPGGGVGRYYDNTQWHCWKTGFYRIRLWR